MVNFASARASWWDYTNAGAYFITICTKNRAHYFGEIDNGKIVAALHATYLHRQRISDFTGTGNAFMAKISPKSNSVSAIIRSYKSAVTKQAHDLGYPFAWQTRFYDIIIRNDDSFHRISNYIINNPSKWKDDFLSK